LFDQGLVVDVPNAVNFEEEDQEKDPVEDKEGKQAHELVLAEIFLQVFIVCIFCDKIAKACVRLVNGQNNVNVGDETSNYTEYYAGKDEIQEALSDQSFLTQVVYFLDSLKLLDLRSIVNLSLH
jgi:hypothetical protein